MTYGNEVLFYGLYNLTALYRTRITHTCHTAIRIPGAMVLTIQDSGPLLTNKKNWQQSDVGTRPGIPYRRPTPPTSGGWDVRSVQCVAINSESLLYLRF